MSFQFFSKLDGKITDGPVSQLDPHRAIKSLVGGTGEASRAISKRIQEDKRQSRMARRAYRSAMRSNDPNQIMAVSRFLNEQGEAGGPGVSRDGNRNIAIAAQEFESRGGDISPLMRRKEEFGSAIESRSSGFGSPSRPSLVSTGVNNPYANRSNFTDDSPDSLKAGFLDDVSNSRLLNDPSVPRAEREVAMARALMKADELGVPRDQVREGGFIASKDPVITTASSGAVLDKNPTVSSYINPEEVAQAQAEAARLKKEGDVSLIERRARLAEINASEADRVAKYGEGGKARTSSLESAGSEGALAQKRIDQVSADKRRVNEMQSGITDASNKINDISQGGVPRIGFLNPLEQKMDKPFIPHGTLSGEMKAWANGSPEAMKRSIDNASAFNSALGGKDVTVKYSDKTIGNHRGSSPSNKRVASAFGNKAVTFQADAFTKVKQSALAPTKGNRGGNVAYESMDKIVKAAVDNNYPIELDKELMAVPEFRTRLSNARLKSGMKTDKITGYTSFQK